MKRRNKYGNHKIKVDGHTFDSKKEAQFYQELIYRKRVGEIKGFTLQPRYELLEGFKKQNKTYRKMEYVADFEIEHLDGSIEVVDIKGHETEGFKLKRKLFDYKYPLKLSVLAYDRRFGGWIDLDELKKVKKKG
ncbi:DUF1064 domain-containing protein [Salinibacillus xinjiangensis]|uniref:DUF1064 domain-containing protein n=1 Tax=Salinibacillus xinjiangensis TaxID=1229268 RepID=A0A6G1X7U9_9BACI|nr:DUF1064 domain-containing protein [Salinibacillus xinjiangensis]MRG86986.1 DUF1064 domain-containing protein [Salinibacillus xinjiangensis]